MMNYDLLLQAILDIGEGLLKSGAENYRIEDSIERMCAGYGFKRYDIFVIPSNIQATVTTPDDRIVTQIRYIERGSTNFDRLDYLNNLSRKVCSEHLEPGEIQSELEEIYNRPKQKACITYAAGILGGACFAVFFGCGMQDAILAVIVSALMVFGGRQLAKIESNLLIYNAVLSFVAEFIILCAHNAGLCEHPDSVMTGIVMLLVSALAVTNGIREIIQRDFISGSLQIMDAVLGASGIALGIALPMMLLNHPEPESYITSGSTIVQLISCTLGCIGFAMWFNIRGKQVWYSGVGAFITWSIYLLVHPMVQSNFMATLIAAIFVALYAHLMSRINRAPMTIFLTASVFPLIPGSNLFYMMFACVSVDYDMILSQFLILIATCIAIAFGFNIVDVITRNVNRVVRKI